MYHCSTHDIDHKSYDCPRCEAERRHEELLEQARESHEEELRYAQERHDEAIEAARESDYRRANPGDYECPHCKYISLKRNATRCPLCHGSPDANYWTEIAAWEEAARERAKAAAIEQARLAKIAADKRAAETEQQRRQAEAMAAQAAAAQRSFAGVAVVVLIVAGIFAWHFASRYLAPPENIVDRGGCPYEGCRYGEVWIARRGGDIYEAAPELVGTASASLAKKAAIRVGDRVTTRGGLVLAKRGPGN